MSLNLRATPARRLESLMPLIHLLGSQEPDVLLLQECRAGCTDLIRRELGVDLISTHERVERTPGLPADGCAVAVRPPLRILSALPVQEQLFSPAAIEALIGPDTPAAQSELDEVARKLNDRPRQTLGFRTPAEKLTELIDGLDTDIQSER